MAVPPSTSAVQGKKKRLTNAAHRAVGSVAQGVPAVPGVPVRCSYVRTYCCPHHRTYVRTYVVVLGVVGVRVRPRVDRCSSVPGAPVLPQVGAGEDGGKAEG